MSKKTEDLVDALSELSVLEMSELKTMLEEKWGVKAAAATVAMAAPAAGAAPAAAAAEATDFQVTLAEAPQIRKSASLKSCAKLQVLA